MGLMEIVLDLIILRLTPEAIDKSPRWGWDVNHKADRT